MKSHKIFLASLSVFAVILSCKNETLDLKQPESVVVTDEFIYVSNVNGNPTEKDSNGYISKLYTNGKVCENKFITGLNAPKGLCVANQVLYVADIDRIAGFDLINGKKVFECKFLRNKTQFLNDICYDGDENIFVSATDINEIFQINIKSKTIIPLYLTGKLNGPNGLVFSDHTLFVCELGKDSIKGGLCKIEFAKDSFVFTRLDNNIGYLDGLIKNENRLYFSDWVNSNTNEKIAKIWVYDLDTKQRVAVKTNERMSGCADIFYDSKNNRIIAPLMNENKVIFIPL